MKKDWHSQDQKMSNIWIWVGFLLSLFHIVNQNFLHSFSTLLAVSTFRLFLPLALKHDIFCLEGSLIAWVFALWYGEMSVIDNFNMFSHEATLDTLELALCEWCYFKKALWCVIKWDQVRSSIIKHLQMSSNILNHHQACGQNECMVSRKWF